MMPKSWVHAATARTAVAGEAEGKATSISSVMAERASPSTGAMGGDHGGSATSPDRVAASTMRAMTSVTRLAGPTVSSGARYPGTGDP